MFPVNPSPYILVYIILVFFCPWCIYGTYVIREIHFLRKHKVFIPFNIITTWKEVKKFRNKNAKSKYLYSKVKKWFVITIILWVLGFIVLGITLFTLEQNNLLINHSKGIY